MTMTPKGPLSSPRWPRTESRVIGLIDTASRSPNARGLVNRGPASVRHAGTILLELDHVAPRRFPPSSRVLRRGSRSDYLPLLAWRVAQNVGSGLAIEPEQLLIGRELVGRCLRQHRPALLGRARIDFRCRLGEDHPAINAQRCILVLLGARTRKHHADLLAVLIEDLEADQHRAAGLHIDLVHRDRLVSVAELAHLERRRAREHARARIAANMKALAREAADEIAERHPVLAIPNHLRGIAADARVREHILAVLIADRFDDRTGARVGGVVIGFER